LIEITRQPDGSVRIKIEEEELSDVKEILSSLFRENSFTQVRVESLSSRFSQLEQSIAHLIEVNRQLAAALGQKRERKMKLPAKGTKYLDLLWRLCSKYLDGIFTSEEVPERQRHILSILKNEYDVLEVAERKGRRNFYRIRLPVVKMLVEQIGTTFSIRLDEELAPQVDQLIAQAREKTSFLVDVSKEDSKVEYRFYVPDASAAESLKEQLAAIRVEPEL